MITGQLTYSCYDLADAGCGGWAIKSVDRIEPHLSNIIAGLCPATFETIEPIPRFASPEQVAAMPRRLAYAPLERGSAQWALWNSAPAGPDGTGRPNVFTHVLVADTWDTRPVSWWRSPGWLTPYGPQEVNASELGRAPEPAPLAPGTAAFIATPEPWRLGILAVALDAVEMVWRTGGPPVVLLAHDMEEVPWWISAITLVTSHRIAERIAFSTYERATAQSGWHAQGFHIVGVPSVDAEHLQRYPGTVVDLSQDSDIGDLRSTNPVAPGLGSITPGRWSVLALDALQNPTDLPALAHELDALSDRLGTGGHHPAWPLALLASIRKNSNVAWESACLIHEATPSAIQNHPDIVAVVKRSLGPVTGDTPGQIFDSLLQHPDGTSAVEPMKVLRYVEAALADDGWLAQEAMPLPPLGSAPPLDHEIDQQFRERAEALVTVDQPDIAVRAANLLGLYRTIAWHTPETLEALLNAVGRTLIAPGFTPVTDPGWRRLGQLPADLRPLIIPKLAGFLDLSRPAGDRLADAAPPALGLEEAQILQNPAARWDQLKTPSGLPSVQPLALEMAIWTLANPQRAQRSRQFAADIVTMYTASGAMTVPSARLATALRGAQLEVLSGPIVSLLAEHHLLLAHDGVRAALVYDDFSPLSAAAQNRASHELQQVLGWRQAVSRGDWFLAPWDQLLAHYDLLTQQPGRPAIAPTLIAPLRAAALMAWLNRQQLGARQPVADAILTHSALVTEAEIAQFAAMRYQHYPPEPSQRLDCVSDDVRFVLEQNLNSLSSPHSRPPAWSMRTEEGLALDAFLRSLVRLVPEQQWPHLRTALETKPSGEKTDPQYRALVKALFDWVNPKKGLFSKRRPDERD